MHEDVFDRIGPVMKERAYNVCPKTYEGEGCHFQRTILRGEGDAHIKITPSLSVFQPECVKDPSHKPSRVDENEVWVLQD